jgi:secondary thiamine-phosphate synthase enzyme
MAVSTSPRERDLPIAQPEPEPPRPLPKTVQREHHLRTAGGLTITDITQDVIEFVRESGVKDGIVCVYSPHTTCSVRVNEFESGLIQDFAVLLRRLIPPDIYYAHDDWGKRTENICPEDLDFRNGHAHCMSMLLGPPGESIPVRNGKLSLGRWQRILLLELDRERERRWLVQVVGT